MHRIRELCELDALRYAELAERMSRFELLDRDLRPRTYPGYPVVPLPRARFGLGASFLRVLARRRSDRRFSNAPPSLEKVAALLGIYRVRGRGGRSCIPAAGGFPALEIYLLNPHAAPFPRGAYHYDREAHVLAEITSEVPDRVLRDCVPSGTNVDGMCCFGVVVGDTRAICEKYGARGYSYLLHQAGALTQTLALTAAAERLGLVVLGGYLEEELSRLLRLPATDAVVSLFAFGRSAGR